MYETIINECTEFKMRLQGCKRFNPEEFLKNLNGWREEKKRLQEELNSMSELPSVNNITGVRGSDISDPTSAQAFRRMKIQKEIEDIEICEQAYEYAMKKLTQDEQDILKGFFEPSMPIWKFVRKWEKEHFVGTTLVYKARRLALNRFSEIIEETYDL